MNMEKYTNYSWQSEDRLGETFGKFMEGLQSGMSEEYKSSFTLLCDTLSSLRRNHLNIKIYLGKPEMVANFLTKNKAEQVRFIEMNDQYNIIGCWNSFIQGLNKSSHIS